MNDSIRLRSLTEIVTDTRTGGRPGGLSPVRMPRVRDQVTRFLADPDSPLTRNLPDLRDGLALATRHLQAADLYWITPDMAALAVAAGQQLDSIPWTTHDRPSGCGLALYAGGVGMVGEPGRSMPIDAMAWGPCPGGVSVTLMVGRWRIGAEYEDRLEADLPPLLVTDQRDIGGGDGATPIESVPEWSHTVWRTLAATWLLMQQPTISETQRGPVDRGLARAYQRAGRPPPVVSIVDLRHLYRPERDEEAADNGREYRHRWVVRGHWRNQAHGPGWSERTRIWVPAYVKGPDGAPLLEQERVNVWRR